MIRPLVLVLKQFLLDRGLLTAYTGGLSSYCLFLMVAKYCQEQVPIWNDCGSLLMGYVLVKLLHIPTIIKTAASSFGIMSDVCIYCFYYDILCIAVSLTSMEMNLIPAALV